MSTSWPWSGSRRSACERPGGGGLANGLLAAVAAGLRCVVTVSSYTLEEDVSEARLVVSDLGEPGAPMRLLANRSKARPGTYLTLADLEACLES